MKTQHLKIFHINQLIEPKLNNTNNNSFSNNRIRFNTKELADHLVSYEDAYISIRS